MLSFNLNTLFLELAEVKALARWLGNQRRDILNPQLDPREQQRIRRELALAREAVRTALVRHRNRLF